uniref:Uncharacterized protein n=1 Tax=Aegilops tauschii subsp. strangulata TaxID=200361 RepID=A0A453QY08_AEGTS
MYCKKMLTSLLMAALLLCSCATSVGTSPYTVGTSGAAKVQSAVALAAEGAHGDRRAAERGARSLGQRVPVKAPPPPKPNKPVKANPPRPRPGPPAPPPPCTPVADGRFG